MKTHVTDDTANGVNSENIERVVVVQEEFELSGEVAACSAKDTEKDSSGCNSHTNPRQKNHFKLCQRMKTHENRRNQIRE